MIENIKNLVPQNLLLELTSGDDAVIQNAVSGACATVDAYVSGAYDKNDSSPFLQSVAEKIAVYNLYRLSAFDETPQIITASYLEAISALEKIQSGLLSPKIGENQRQKEVFSNKTSSDKMFGKDNLKGY
jgi:phage gp36-like protein